MFKKLHKKVLLLNMAVTFAVLLIAFGAVYVTTLNSINTDNQRRLDGAVGAIMLSARPIVIHDYHTGPEGIPVEHVMTSQAGNVMVFNNPGLEQAIVVNRDTGEHIPAFGVIVDSSGNLLRVSTSYDYPRELYEEAALAAWSTGGQSTMTLFGRTWLYKIAPLPTAPPVTGVYQPVEPSNDSRIVFLDITDSMKTLQNLRMTILFVGLGMLVVIFGVSYFFTRRAIQPVAVAWEKQRQFVADASHELKTPLATMMTNYDVVVSNEESSVESQKEWLGYLKIGMDRMNKVINNLLSLARLESGELGGEKSSFDLSTLVASTMQQMEGKAQEKNLNLISNFTGELPVVGNADMTEQVFSILYDNALKYANEGGTIEVVLQQTKKHAVCTVKNTGKGISPEDLPHIFDRFYRADTARTSEDNSHGLGLPIARAIAEQLGGSITASSEQDGWTEFVLTLEL
ncbi:MAG: HAMP domain-containing histidine kinase [Coriobacteriia bacterium]|nr:HAMP domain-containing histidine kinase [Coriobacteriia bacterium]MCL2749943.1 HAMP domain-containing histidine kinase [Coriobacteriia bacterium]